MTNFCNQNAAVQKSGKCYANSKHPQLGGNGKGHLGTALQGSDLRRALSQGHSSGALVETVLSQKPGSNHGFLIY